MPDHACANAETNVRIVQPTSATRFRISSVPEWPDIVFIADTPGAYDWRWTLAFGRHRRSGIAQTAEARWNARGVITDLGGTLTVTAILKRVTTPANPGQLANAARNGSLAGIPIATSGSISISIVGTNPTEQEVLTYLATKPDRGIMERIVRHESRFRQFRDSGEPLGSFDGGFGLTQLTNPAPRLEEMWNWKRNIDAGLRVLAEKRAQALTFFATSGSAPTEDQLLRETVSRWNGGSYYAWEASTRQWIRRPEVLCDSRTGNIGWDVRRDENRGMTEEALHRRDAASYRGGREPGDSWRYFGTCYADAVLGAP
jgi:hypothetical protein